MHIYVCMQPTYVQHHYPPPLSSYAYVYMYAYICMYATYLRPTPLPSPSLLLCIGM